MQQSTIPSLSQTILPRWASRQFLGLPVVHTLLPVYFGYSLSSEAVVMRQLRRWKRLWRKSLTRSHKRTSMGRCRSCWDGTSALQPEEITSEGMRASCVPIRKKSGNLSYVPRISGIKEANPLVCKIYKLKKKQTTMYLENYLINSWIICHVKCFFPFFKTK